MSIEQKLSELGITLPQAPPPAASYKPFIIVDKMIYVAGQLPLEGGDVRYVGRLGDDMEVDMGYAAARLCGINILAQLRVALDGSLDRVRQFVKIGGFVQCTPEFTAQPQVVNGASELIADVFGDRGSHARFAVGTNALPRGVAVEVEATVAFD